MGVYKEFVLGIMVFFVFVKEKLISADSILPVCLSLKKEHQNTNFHFICPTLKTEDEIKKNFILSHGVSLIGEASNLEAFSPASKIGSWLNANMGSKATRKIRKIVIISKVAVSVFFRKGCVFHFGFWEHPTLAWFTHLFRKRFFYFSQNCWGSSDAINYIDHFNQERIEKCNVSGRAVFVSFDKSWTLLPTLRELGCQVLYLKPSRQSFVWRDFIEKNCGQLIEAEVRKLKIKSSERVVGIILSNLDGVSWMEQPNTPEIMLKKTIRLFSEKFPDIRILIKPHPVTEMRKLHEIVERYSSGCVNITYLHSSALANICDFVLCNKFSFAMADVWAAGTTTIEYTKYPNHFLEKTQHDSMRAEFIDHFIQDDVRRLEEVVKEIYENKNINTPKFLDLKFSEILGIYN